MSERGATGRPPGPKTAIRSGAAGDAFGVILGEREHAAARDRGAAVRRDLVDEIREQAAARPARKRRRTPVRSPADRA